MGAEKTPVNSMLKSLRSIVQEVVTARDLPQTLQIIVRRVRDAMGTEVCSVYIHDAEHDRYVFMATEGLNKQLEGQVSLALDEGLIGYVARREEPLNLENAESHPHYKYIENSGEEVFKAFLGVPIEVTISVGKARPLVSELVELRRRVACGIHRDHVEGEWRPPIGRRLEHLLHLAEQAESGRAHIGTMSKAEKNQLVAVGKIPLGHRAAGRVDQGKLTADASLGAGWNAALATLQLH